MASLRIQTYDGLGYVGERFIAPVLNLLLSIVIVRARRALLAILGVFIAQTA
jgi:hypothetical protein